MPESSAAWSGEQVGLRPRHPSRTPLSALFPDQQPGVPITGITLDSRLVQPGDLYVALPGRARHGADFAGEAVAAGAVAVLTDAAGAELVRALAVPVVVRDDVRQGLGQLASTVYGHPSRGRLMFGITGTNGKTTTAYLLAAALRALDQRTGVVGTLGFTLDGEALAGARTTITTPEAPELQAVLAVLAEGGARAVAMEVSSHALALGRADGIVFDVAAFTNLGDDHLEFHGDEESYFEAKALLFTRDRTRAAVLSVDDPRGRQLVERIGSALPVVTVSTRGPADYRLRSAEPAGTGVDVVADTPTGEVAFRLGLPGEFNIRNALTALAMLAAAGLDAATGAQGLAAAAVPGRMEPVALEPPGPTVVVDFAHTPQAVGSLLRSLAGRRRVAVLGSGGDRDPHKRGPMGAAAVAEAELVVVTDDNPRSEDPAAIRAAVLHGAYLEQARQTREGRSVEVVDGGDRRAAIAYALRRAETGDVVAVLGKGHEAGQEVAGEIHPFDDRDVVRTVWAGLVSSDHGAAS